MVCCLINCWCVIDEVTLFPGVVALALVVFTELLFDDDFLAKA